MLRQTVVPRKVLLLIQRHPAVFINAALDQLHHDLQLLQQILLFSINIGAIGQGGLHQTTILDQALPIRQELAVGFEELGLNGIFR